MATNNTARLREVCNGIVTELNAEVAAKNAAGTAIAVRQFTATREWRIDPDNQELKTTKVYVRPIGIEFEARDRSQDVGTRFYTVEITVQEAISPKDTDAIDRLEDLANRIAERFKPLHTLTATGVTDVNVQECFMTVYDPAQLDSGRFFSKIDLRLVEL